MSEIQTEIKMESAEKPLAMNALKFAMWLFIVSIVMIFASLTSAYIVRRSEGNWLEFELPSLFYITTIVLLISSGTMHYSLIQAKKDNLYSLKIGMIATTFLGLFFVIGQFFAWNQLVQNKVFFAGSNPSASFVYVLSGLHAFHIVAGLIFLIIVFYMSLADKIHSKSILWMEMCTTFWHFLDGLWLYLFFFLILNR
ncbi:MAG: cytochrome c oxidase subunit 3 [Bacteroidota bacterium]|nr:cytochrome c oxidase subunit 3 [Bacteroidota bacterium]